MTKFYGEIGYQSQVEVRPGVFVEDIVTRTYFGDVLRMTSRMRDGKNLNDDLTIDNRLSIVADPFAYENFSSMRYVDWMGALWKITAVEVQRPRLILTIGGVYNEQTT